MAIGIDLPTDVGICFKQLAPAGVQFVGRYYRRSTSHWPALSASESHLLTSVGIATVALWEFASDTASYFTYVNGVDDSTTAYRQAQAAQQPAGKPIYFAVDCDASQSDIDSRVRDYFHGIQAGFEVASKRSGLAYPIGVYGSGSVCQSLLSGGIASFTWLASSRAWSGNKEFTKWNIRQSTKRLPGITCDHDSNESQGDYGGFVVG